MNIDTKASGPLFDGAPEREVQQFIEDATGDIAKEGVTVVRGELHAVLQHPTGRYESRIQTDISTSGAAVTDGGVVYGPWLAGMSSLNRSSRFKGYQHWRRATQRLQARAAELSQRALDDLVRRLS